MRIPRKALATACLATACLAIFAGEALAAGAPTVTTGTNTFDNHGGTIVRAYVDPNGEEVGDCRFLYGLDESYGREAPCGNEAGAGTDPVEVKVDLTSLDSGALYHFKVLATNASGSEESEDGVFAAPGQDRQSSCSNQGKIGAGFLPDCRAWEMVSPPDKQGGDVMPHYGRVRVASDGSAASFASVQGFGDVIGTSVAAEYMALRSGNPQPGNQGWSTHSITPRQQAVTAQMATKGAETRYDTDFSPDLSTGVIQSGWPLTDDLAVEGIFKNLYLRRDLRTPGPGDYQLISACPLCEGFPLLGSIEASADIKYVGASADFTHIVFESPFNLAEGAGGSKVKLYEWDHGTVRLVGIAPDGTPFPNSTTLSGETKKARHVISADGSKIFFTDGTSLYMRVNGTETVKLNTSELDPPQSSGGAIFLDASPDGSRVFFLSGRLTSDTPPLEGNVGSPLFMYDTTKPPEDEHNLTLVSTDTEPADDIELVTYAPGAGEGGHSFYFVVKGNINGGRLVRNQPLPPNPGEGTYGIYLWHDGTVSFVAWLGSSLEEPETNSDAAKLTVGNHARIAADGTLFFTSQAYETVSIGPAGYDHGDCGQGNPCEEAYLYNPHTSQLECVSCNPRVPKATAAVEVNARQEIGFTRNSGHLNNPLSADGRYAFFTTAEALVPNDTNGQRDVYRYDAKTGNQRLISSGEADSPSLFMDASPSGNDAFFATRERLSGWDVDGNFDLYDARIGGGFPEPPAPPPGCVGDACQPTPTQLNDPTPSSSSFHGAGNRAKAHKGKKQKKHRAKAKRRHDRHAKHERRAAR